MEDEKNRLKTYIDILKAVKNGSERINHMVYDVGIGFPRGRKYLNFLRKRGLVEVSKGSVMDEFDRFFRKERKPRKHTKYVITSQGERAIDLYESLKELTGYNSLSEARSLSFYSWD